MRIEDEPLRVEQITKKSDLLDSGIDLLVEISSNLGTRRGPRRFSFYEGTTNRDRISRIRTVGQIRRSIALNMPRLLEDQRVLGRLKQHLPLIRALWNVYDEIKQQADGGYVHSDELALARAAIGDEWRTLLLAPEEPLEVASVSITTAGENSEIDWQKPASYFLSDTKLQELDLQQLTPIVKKTVEIVRDATIQREPISHTQWTRAIYGSDTETNIETYKHRLDTLITSLKSHLKGLDLALVNIAPRGYRRGGLYFLTSIELAKRFEDNFTLEQRLAWVEEILGRHLQ